MQIFREYQRNIIPKMSKVSFKIAIFSVRPSTEIGCSLLYIVYTPYNFNRSPGSKEVGHKSIDLDIPGCAKNNDIKAVTPVL